MADEEEDVKVPKALQVKISPITPVSDIRSEPWFTRQWRPLAAYTYLIICIFDFMLAPIAMGVLSVLTKTAYVVWTPLTIQGASMFHLSFGAIIGLYSWGRTQERIAGVEKETTGVTAEFEKDEEEDCEPPPRRGSRRKPRGG
jgi:hypothetical protein